MAEVLKPFVEMINRLSNEGISYQVNGEDRRIYLYICVCVVDSGARPALQGNYKSTPKNKQISKITEHIHIILLKNCLKFDK